MIFFASKMNKFVFMVPLPVLVFEDLATVDFSKVWDVKFVLFLFYRYHNQYYDFFSDFLSAR